MPSLEITDNQYPQRKSIRAEFHDYSGGTYFVTICTRDKLHYFGTIHNTGIHLTAVGRYAAQALESLHQHYSYVEVPLFVVMPNHIHAILYIRESSNPTTGLPAKRTALSVVVGGYKQSVTMFARRNSIDFGWQKRYHDHIIRGMNDCTRIAKYIENNIAAWSADCYYT